MEYSAVNPIYQRTYTPHEKLALWAATRTHSLKEHRKQLGKEKLNSILKSNRYMELANHRSHLAGIPELYAKAFARAQEVWAISDMLLLGNRAA